MNITLKKLEDFGKVVKLSSLQGDERKDARDG